MKDAASLLQEAQIELHYSYEVPDNVIQAFMDADTIYFDTETTGLSPWRSELALIQMYDPKSQYVLLCRINENWIPEQWIMKLFSQGKLFIGHNIASFDIPFIAVAGLPWEKSRYYDTLIGETVCATSTRSDISKSLRASVKRRVGLEVNKDIEHGGWRNTSLREDQIRYAAIDVLVLPDLYEAQLERAADSKQANALNMEMEVLPVFASMTINGLPINQDMLSKYMDDQMTKMKKAQVILERKLGRINYNSPVQVKKALHDIGIEVESTSKNTLLDIIEFDPESQTAELLDALLAWRKPSKRTAMYGSEDWQKIHIQPDGRIHARFWQVGADTTRVSSSDPNLQQVPKDGRFIFGSLPGYKIVSVDYSQIEVRIAAAISHDIELMRVLTEDDVHRAVAASVFKKNPENISKEERKLAKAMVFALLFGGGPARFYEHAKHSGSKMTQDDALEMFRAFFAAFTGLWDMRCKAYALCRNNRVLSITLPNGARRVLVGAKKSPTVVLNTPVQGTAAVGMKLGLIEAHKRGLSKYIGAVVHDEAVSTVPANEAEEYAKEMQDALITGMSTVVGGVKILAEIARNPDKSLPDIWLP